MPRQRRLSARSVASSESTTAISPGRRCATARAAATRARSGAATPGSLGLLATEIGIGAAPAGFLGFLGVGRAHVEDRGEHWNERLAHPRQLEEREAAIVELPLLDPLLDDARDQPADAARRRFGECPGGAPDAVGQHQDRGLLPPRARAGVAEVVAHRGWGLLQRLVV